MYLLLIDTTCTLLKTSLTLYVANIIIIYFDLPPKLRYDIFITILLSLTSSTGTSITEPVLILLFIIIITHKNFEFFPVALITSLNDLLLCSILNSINNVIAA